MSQQQIQRQFSFETISSLDHTKKLLEPSSFKNYLSQQSAFKKMSKTSNTFQRSNGFEDINFNVSPLDMPHEPVYSNMNFISRNFGNLCDRVFREQSRSSQRQKFGPRNKQEAAKSLLTQQENLSKLQQTTASSSRPQKKIYGTGDERVFYKHIFNLSNEKVVVMVKSLEITADRINNNSNANNSKNQTRKRLCKYLPFQDLRYLITNFNLDEIMDLFTTCTFINRGQIEFDFTKFTNLPLRRDSKSAHIQKPYPNNIEVVQVSALRNSEGYEENVRFNVQFPHIEFYISDLALKQQYYLPRDDILDLLVSQFDSLPDYLKHFDEDKLRTGQQMLQRLQSEEIVEQLISSNSHSRKQSQETFSEEKLSMKIPLIEMEIDQNSQRLHTISEGDHHQDSLENEESRQDLNGYETELPNLIIVDGEREGSQAELEGSEITNELEGSVYSQALVTEMGEFTAEFRSLEILMDSNAVDEKIVKQLSFIELYSIIIQKKRSNKPFDETISEWIFQEEDGEIILQFPQITFDIIEVQSLDQNDILAFLEQLIPQQIEIGENSYSFEFSKPCIEYKDKEGNTLKIVDADEYMLYEIIKRKFHFLFAVG